MPKHKNRFRTGYMKVVIVALIIILSLVGGHLLDALIHSRPFLAAGGPPPSREGNTVNLEDGRWVERDQNGHYVGTWSYIPPTPEGGVEDAPEPDDPEPDDSEPGAPELTPETDIPDPLIPEPDVPEQVIPELAMPEPSIPEPLPLEPIVSELFILESVITESVMPEPAIPDPVILEPIVQAPVISAPVIPESVTPEPTINVPVIPEPAMPAQDMPETIVTVPEVPEIDIPSEDNDNSDDNEDIIALPVNENIDNRNDAAAEINDTASAEEEPVMAMPDVLVAPGNMLVRNLEGGNAWFEFNEIGVPVGVWNFDARAGGWVFSPAMSAGGAVSSRNGFLQIGAFNFDIGRLMMATGMFILLIFVGCALVYVRKLSRREDIA